MEKCHCGYCDKCLGVAKPLGSFEQICVSLDGIIGKIEEINMMLTKQLINRTITTLPKR
jgi:hypothetical protein